MCMALSPNRRLKKKTTRRLDDLIQEETHPAADLLRSRLRIRPHFAPKPCSKLK